MVKIYLKIVFATFMSILLFNTISIKQVYAGPGDSANNPYEVRTIEDLREISTKTNLSKHYKLMNDIDFNGAPFESIHLRTESGAITAFSGSFDGNGYIIKNLKISTTYNETGMFARTDGAVIKNLILENVNITGGNKTGSLAGSASNSIIENCAVITTDLANSSKVTGKTYSGGLVGYSNGSQITRCYSTVNVESKSSEIGGLIGHAASTASNSKVSECYSTGNVVGSGTVGGLIGKADSTKNVLVIENCFALGSAASKSTSISSKKNTGGLIGVSNVNSSGSLTVQNCYSIGDVEKGGGGLIGNKKGIVISCYYDFINAGIIESQADNYTRFTSGMLEKETYYDWNFDSIWTLEEGSRNYPYLKNLQKPTSNLVIAPQFDLLEGAGTSIKPYLIKTTNDFYYMNLDVFSHYKLNDNINFFGNDFGMIGKPSLPFSGIFDGNGKTISNLKISQGKNKYIGLFSYTYGAKIKNVNISGMNVQGKDYTGALVGYAEKTVIDNSKVNDSILVGNKYTGGLVGYFIDGEVSQCQTSKMNIQGGECAGGLIGYNYGIVDGSSVVDITLTSTRSSGGLVGFNTGNITKCYSTGSVTGSMYTGGLVGRFYSEKAIENKNQLKISECYANVDVYGSSYIGGLIGEMNANVIETETSNCFSLGKVDCSNEKTGGLIGAVSKKSKKLNSKVKNCFSSTFVTNGIGGLVDTNNGNIENCYFDAQTSGIALDNLDSSAKLTSGLLHETVFEDWGFVSGETPNDGEYWAINEGNTYPYLYRLGNPHDQKPDIGAGTEILPYTLTTPYSFKLMEYEPSAYYSLEEKKILDFSGLQIAPLFTGAKEFTGIFDGNGSTIIGLKINNTVQNTGLFSKTLGAKILNLTLKEVDITGRIYTGSLIGIATDTNVENCVVTGVVTGSSYTGGLIGSSKMGEITESNTEVNVKGGSRTGGLIGWSSDVIDSCFATGDVTASTSSSSNLGGLVGQLTTNLGTYSEISRCYATGKVTGYASIGGLVGYANADNYDAGIINSFALGNVKATNNTDGYCGGLVGSTNRDTGYNLNIYACYAKGNIEAEKKGGLIGKTVGTEVNYSYYDSDATNVEISVDTSAGIGRITTTMFDRTNYETWDFYNTWIMKDGASYPYLIDLKRPTDLDEGDAITHIPPEGSGTAEHPFLIKTQGDFNTISSNPIAYYKLNNNIEFDGNYTPVCTLKRPFKGTFDGGGNTISNLTINSLDCTGLFAYTNGAKIKNLNISVNDIVGKKHTGALIGQASDTNVDNCFVFVGNTAEKGIITKIGSGFYAGGLIGYIDSGNVVNCGSAVNSIESWKNVGGLIGFCGANVSKSYSYSGIVLKSLTTGITGDNNIYAGGLICYATTLKIGDITISECFSSSSIKSSQYTGGFIANAFARKGDINITDCFVDNVVIDCKSRTSAGFISQSQKSSNHNVTIKNCYTAAKFTYVDKKQGYTFAKGFSNERNSNKINCFYDSTVNKYKTDSSGNPIVQPGVAKTQSELRTNIPFVGWNTGIWLFVNNYYPTLKNIIMPDIILSAPKNFKIADFAAGENSSTAKLTWDKVNGVNGYIIDVSSDDDKYTISIDSGDICVKELKNLKPGEQYAFRIKSKSNKNSLWSSAIRTYEYPEPLEILNTNRSPNSITINWRKVYGATKYVAVLGDDELETSQTNITFEQLDSDTYYSFVVYAYSAKGVLLASSDATDSNGMATDELTNENLDVPKQIVLFKKENNALYLTWEKIEYATEYDIYCDEKITSAARETAVISNLDLFQEHVVKVRAKDTSSVGRWSEEVIIGPNDNPLAQVRNIASNYDNANPDKITLFWDSVLNAKKYIIKSYDDLFESDNNSGILDYLALGVEYSVVVQAKNDYFYGPESEVFRFTTVYGEDMTENMAIRIEKDKIYNIAINASNVGMNKKISVIFDTNDLEFLGLSESGLKNVIKSSGGLSFAIDRPSDTQSYSGVITVIRFKAKNTCSTEIKIL